MLDKELIQKTFKSYLQNHSILHKEYTIRPLDATEFSLSSGWIIKEVQKYGKKDSRKYIKKEFYIF
ncbi:hypothetical protein C1645_815414 [Glomus cerebriforme]|uniref:Uncharacterized protein n=1 Tax=Glomus cerebriforme TaxID=658196 RepID=A0A397TIT2_9GLOM|nr:hypothetical protein C1645_815414 [Glomus cerebriforme]